MAADSNSEVSLESPYHECHLCQLSVPAGAWYAHKRGLQHRAARKVAAVALDRWRAYMTAGLTSEPVEDNAEPDAENENVMFCDICNEAVPSTTYTRHMSAKTHLIAALDGQVFEELVRVYVDEEDLKLLEDEETDVSDAPGEKRNVNDKQTCHICALQVPSPFKAEHDRSIHHRSRVALANAASRRLSAFLHETPIGVTEKRSLKLTELLKTYTGIDLLKKDEVVVEKEIEIEEKATQSEVKKRLTAKQYFTDILPYLQYTEALYTLIIDDSDYITVKNTNGTCFRVHITNFNGVYCDSRDSQFNMRCRMCDGINRYGYSYYTADMDHDRLHVMSLGHIRHVLTPIDNVHGIRKISHGHSLCVICNTFMADNCVEEHIYNDLHHTGNLSEALKRGKGFKESKNDLKIIIYSAPPVKKSDFMRYPVTNYDSVLYPRNHIPYNGLFGGNVSFPQGNAPPQGMPKPPGATLFGASNTGVASNSVNTSNSHTFGGGTGFGASSGSFAQPESTNFRNPGGSVFGASNVQASPNVASPAGHTFGTPAGGSVFGASNAQASPNVASPAGHAFGTPAGGSVFGASNAQASPNVAGPAGTMFATHAGKGFGAGQSIKPASTGAFAQNAGGSVFGTNSGTGFASPASAGAFGAQTSSGFGASTGFEAGTDSVAVDIAPENESTGDGANNGNNGKPFDF